MVKPTVLGYMRDQPRALKAVYHDRDEFVKPFEQLFKKHSYKKVLFFGSGTSYNASQIAAYYFKHIVGIDAAGCYPTVFMNYEKPDWADILKKDEILFVGISQSGTSISTINVMKWAKKQGYQTVALTENLKSEITKHVDTTIHLLCGKELTPPETRGYTVTLLTLYLWALAAAVTVGKMDKTAYKAALAETKQFVGKFEMVVKESESWFDRNATTIVSSDRIYVLGYGIDYGSALEGMLKIGEMLRVPSIGYEIEEYSHGPTMALNGKTTIFMIGSDEEEWGRCLQFRTAFKKYTERVHLVTCKETAHDDRDVVFSVKTNKYLAPIMYTVPFQFAAAKGAMDTNIDTSINPFKEELSHLPD
jgi:glucoselysine-6-phosphate deglycase